MNARSLLGIGVVAGVATLAYVAFDPRRALLAWIAAFAMLAVTGLAGLVLRFVLELVHAKWWLALRPPFEAAARLPIIVPLFFLPLAVFGGHVYGHYSAGWVLRGALYCAIWAGLAFAASRRRSGALAAAGILVIAFTLTAASFDWLMDLQPEWTSSLYGIWMFAEGFCGAMAAIAVGAHFAKRAHVLPDGVAPDHFGALGRLLLCALMVWAYIGFFQLLLVWLPDLPHEVTFFSLRVANGWALVSGLVVARFAIALLALLSRELKRSSAALAAIGGFLLLTEALDCAWLVLPSVGARLSPLDALPFIAVAALAAAYGAHVATRVPPPAELDVALRYRSP